METRTTDPRPSAPQDSGKTDLRPGGDEFWESVRPADEPMRRVWFLPLVLLLLTVSIPWYRSRGGEPRLMYGLPDWVWVTLACSFLLSVVTALVAIFCWRDDAE